jgi:hypothetical protein
MDYQNRKLRAVFYRDWVEIPAAIQTLNGNEFISTAHFGVQWIGGTGSAGQFWSPAERICIDFADGTFHPGESVRVDIIDKISNVEISRHTYQYDG